MAIAALLVISLECKEEDNVFTLTFVNAAKPGIFDDFIEFAKKHSELDFLVTEIGCGIAGFTNYIKFFIPRWIVLKRII